MDDLSDNNKQTHNNQNDDQDELAVIDDSIVSLDELEEKPELNYGDTYDEANIGFEELEDDNDVIDIDLDDEDEGVEDFAFDDDDL